MTESVLFAKLPEWVIVPLYAAYWHFIFSIFFSEVVLFLLNYTFILLLNT